MTPEEAQEIIAKHLDDPNMDASNPEYLAALSVSMGAPPEGEEEQAPQPGASEPAQPAGEGASPSTTATNAQAPDAAAGEGGEGTPAAVIKSKDGRREIPYSELETARTQLAEALRESEDAKATARQLADLVATMQSAIEERQPGRGGGPVTTEIDGDLAAQIEATKASMAKIEEEFPDLAPHLKPWHAMMEQQTKVLAHLEQQRLDELRREQEQRAAAVRSNIEQVPALAYWMKSSPQLFEEAKVQDRLLRSNPEWKDKPEVERFSKVVEVMVALRGPKVLEGIPARTPAKPGATAAPAVAAPKAPASPDAVLAKALGISSLSDLPGGAPVSADPNDLGEMSAEQMAARFARLSDSELFAQLGRYGTG